MAQPSDSLIFDRAAADITRARTLAAKVKAGTETTAERTEWDAGLKAYMNADDMNRIDEWTRYVADLLIKYGYMASVTTKTWARGEEFSLSDINRMRRNIDALQNAFCSIPEWREITYTSTLGFEQVNSLEWDLQYILTWFERMVQSFLYFGEVYAGEVI